MKKPIAVWLTDTHLKEDTIQINKYIYDQVLQICIDSEIPGIIHGGDIFDNRRRGQPESVLVAFAEILQKFESLGINFIAIPGNHDKQNLLGYDSTLNAFEGWNRFFLYKDYSSIDFSQGKVRFHFIPYFDEKLFYSNPLQKAVDNIRFDYTNILFTHIAVSGVTNNDGTKVTSDITVDRFKHFHQVLVGHYHNRQSFGNVLYTGSAYQANFGEDKDKGCTVIYDDGTLKFLKLDFPKYITQIKKSADQKIEDPECSLDHYRVKLKYKPSPSEIAVLQESGYKIIYDLESDDKEHLQDVKTQFTTCDIVKYFNQWCDEQGVENKQFGLKLLQS